MNEDDARLNLDRAHRAKRIYEDELFVDAVEGIKERLWKDFSQSKLDDDTLRLQARIGIDMLDKICGAFRKHMENGKLAQRDLSLVEERKRA